MNKLKNIGLTALAGSLVAVTSAANAGELSVSGSAQLSYTSKSGDANATDTGQGFGMQHLISMSGSGELDNGMTVSLYHDIEQDGTGGSTSAISLDMGSAGVLTYQQGEGNIGIAKVDDVMPTADEEVSNGTSGDANATTYQADMGGSGFDYVYSFDMGKINFAYSPNNSDDQTDDGGVGGTGEYSGQSVHVDLKPMDGLRVVAGIGEDGAADVETIAAVYSYGPVVAGYQLTERSDGQGSITDTDETYASIAFAVNDNLSISYGVIETDIDGAAKDQEQKGFGIGYSMGGITLNAHRNTLDDDAGAETDEYEHTEIKLSFAF